MRFFAGLLVGIFAVTAVGAYLWQTRQSTARFSDVKVVFLSVGQKQDENIRPLMRGLEWAENDFGCDIKVWWCGWYNTDILENFAAAILYEPDAICVPGYENEAGFAELVEEAVAKGMRVTTYSVPLPETMERYQLDGMGYAGYYPYASGQKLAERAVQMFNLRDGKKVLVFGNSRLNADLRMRPKAMHDTMQQFGIDATLIDMREYWHGDSPRGVPAALQEYLEGNPKPDCILFDAGGLEDLLQAFKEADISPGEILVAGFDSSIYGFQGMRDGYVQLLYVQRSSLWSYLTVLQACLSVKNNATGMNVTTPGVFVDRENISYLEQILTQDGVL